MTDNLLSFQCSFLCLQSTKNQEENPDSLLSLYL